MSNTTDNLKRGGWTAKEIQMLIDHYPTMRTTKLAEMLHRAPHSVKARANKMGIRKSVVVTRPSRYTRKEAQPKQVTPAKHVTPLPRLCHSCVNYPCFSGIDNLETDFARVGCRGYTPKRLNKL